MPNKEEMMMPRFQVRGKGKKGGGAVLGFRRCCAELGLQLLPLKLDFAQLCLVLKNNKQYVGMITNSQCFRILQVASVQSFDGKPGINHPRTHLD